MSRPCRATYYGRNFDGRRRPFRITSLTCISLQNACYSRPFKHVIRYPTWNHMSAWSEFTVDEYAKVWDRFYADFKFKPDYYERTKPAIFEPPPYVTFGLLDSMSDELWTEIDNQFLDSFRIITPTGRLLYWLDWQHTCFRFDPHVADGFGGMGWYPDGDYYMFLADDFSFGTFGHPWQRSLCVFGASLLGLVEQSLRKRMTVVRESTR